MALSTLNQDFVLCGTSQSTMKKWKHLYLFIILRIAPHAALMSRCSTLLILYVWYGSTCAVIRTPLETFTRDSSRDWLGQQRQVKAQK